MGLKEPFGLLGRHHLRRHLRGFLEGHPFDIGGPFGVTYNPLTGKWGPSADADVNYMMTVARGE